MKIGNKVKSLVNVDDDIKIGDVGKIVDIIGTTKPDDYEIEFPIWVQFKKSLTQFSVDELEVIK